MILTPQAFRDQQQKCITLLGMSGVGKTHLSNMLRRHDWFHFSGDYRIGTRYLDEAILDNIKRQAMRIPFLRDLLRSDSIYIRNNIGVDNLNPVSTFLGKLGNPEQDGLDLAEFSRRQALHLDAEISAMLDVPHFIGKSRDIYGYSHFVNDAGGSLCDLEREDVFQTLYQHTVILYIAADEQDEARLLEAARRDPKPLYYRAEFLNEQLEIFMRERGFEYVALIDPDDFGRWIVPRLIQDRRPRYEYIARRYGITVSARDIGEVRDEADFNALVECALDVAAHA